ncbi:4-hydroxythreonine-4-phosphate dehydrogenase PdxA [Rhodothermus bifroesti]|uniref:4-hydroxythreonine-4-phosphate dehydrogenase n=1 Tax=Rhodothermus marinus TaxID=29549 RepID=A0A7V2F606_RHOMR|nr:4-hydroxythreonine-4-phosphate dehydrogenase PdxA [Rhodothermus bifroesti]GBD02175.1 4-hydroxythreonine-4-phosphate dehydrogenase 2 [bacterium HR18]
MGIDTGRTRLRIAITLGDPNGIGPEIVLKCLADTRLVKFFDPLVVGSAAVLEAHAQAMDLPLPSLLVVERVPDLWPEGQLVLLNVDAASSPKVQFGKVTPEGGRLAMKAVEQAVRLCLEGQADALVTAPISKEAIALAGYTDPGHTEFIARLTKSVRFTMMMVADGLRIGLVTGHMPLGEVPKHVTQAAILEKVEILHQSLVQDFGIDRPKIAVLGLNPHAGDGGVLGREETEILLPAIAAACRQGYLVFGPFPADSFFGIGAYRRYDAVLAMYHDQGLVPFKTLAFESGVNYTAGLPIVRTSPDHGTAYNIAGQGKASPESMRSALYLAWDIARRRKERLAASFTTAAS